MNLLEDISLAMNGLRANKMRALLTMLGIIIGIGSVIAISSVGNAMTNSVNEAMATFGVTNIQVFLNEKDDSRSFSTKISEDDLFSTDMFDQYREKFSDKIAGIGLSCGVGSGKIKNNHTTYKVDVSGVNADCRIVNNVEMLKGRFISEKDDQRAKNVAVISERLAASLFSAAQNPLGSEIKVEMQNSYETFTVVGVYKQEAAPAFMPSNSTKTTFYIPVNTAKRLTDADKGYSNFTVSAKLGTDCTQFAMETKNFFDKLYVNNKKFESYTQSMESMISETSNIMNTLSLAVSVIAGISLLVGGIGVMNIMLVSVTERTREIGIRKALGARDSAIRSQFIIESMIICIIGGVLGIFVGAGLGYAGGMLLQQKAVPTLDSIAVAVGFSMAIGVFFGFYPANKAAKLDPIEALRYE